MVFFGTVSAAGGAEMSHTALSHHVSMNRVATVSLIGEISANLSPTTDSILSSNTLGPVCPRWSRECQGVTQDLLYKLWTNWREVLRDSNNHSPWCGPGFARTLYKHRTPCGEFDN